MNYPFFKPGSYTFFTREAILEGGTDYPKMLNIEPTNDCNFMCTMCSRRTSNRPVTLMPMDLYRSIIDDVVRQKKRIRWLTLHKDGEPLLHPEIARMVRYARQSGAVDFIHFNTNAQLLDEETAASLIEAGLDDITLSIDALSEETFAAVKRAGELATVRSNTLRLMELRSRFGRRNPWVRAKIIDMPTTRHELQGFVDYWRPLVDEVQIQPVHNAAGALQTEQVSPGTHRFPCSLLWYSVAVNCDGTVSPCCVDLTGDNLIGDLRRETLREVFVEGRIRHYREKMMQGCDGELTPCCRCDAWKNGINLFER